MDLVHLLTDVDALVRWGGYLGLSLIVYVETGLMVGFFLPGDSLLVMAGLFAAQGHFDIVILNVLLITMAIAGDATGYLIGRSIGPRLFERPSTRLFRREHLIRTRLYYEEHGGKTIVIARFVPVLRTFAPVVAGIAGMNFRRFAFFNVSGAIGWVLSMTLIGYGLGRLFPGVVDVIEWVILGIIAVSMMPIVWNQWTMFRQSERARRVFDHSTRTIFQSLAQLRIDWSGDGLAHASQILSAMHDAGSIVQNGRTPLGFRVVAPDDPGIRRLEIEFSTLATSDRSGEAAREWLALQLSQRYDEAIRIGRDVLGAPEDSETGSWRIENGRVRIHRTEEPSTGLFRLFLSLEPVEMTPPKVA